MTPAARDTAPEQSGGVTDMVGVRERLERLCERPDNPLNGQHTADLRAILAENERMRKGLDTATDALAWIVASVFDESPSRIREAASSAYDLANAPTSTSGRDGDG